jgi:hypothetical protein
VVVAPSCNGNIRARRIVEASLLYPSARLLHFKFKDDKMRNTLLSPRRRAVRLASTAALLLVLPVALAAFGAQAQSLPEDPGEAVELQGDTVQGGAVADSAGAITPAPAAVDQAHAAVQGDVALDAPAAMLAEDQAAVGAEPASAAPPSVATPEEMQAPAEPAAAHAAINATVPTSAAVDAGSMADAIAASTETAVAPAPTPATPTEPVVTPDPEASPVVDSVPVPAAPTVAAAAVPAASLVSAPEAVPAPQAIAAPQANIAPAAVAAPVATRPPFVNENNAIERQLGARCPNDLAARMANQGDLLTGACQGTMPAHLAAVLVAIPDAQIHLPRAWRQREVAQRAWFKAVPGAGQRPDFLAVQGGLWIRSFEGADANTTVYLVSAPFECVDGRVLDADAGEPVRVPAGDCRQAFVQERVYRVNGTGAPVDITAQVMPARPMLGEADKKRYAAKGGEVTLDRSKLQYGPAMRWYVRFDEAGTPADARSFGEWSRAHLGFVVWNGQRFEQVDSVPRSQWPCDPVAPGDAVCGGFADAGRDPFVLSDAAMARTEGATP